MPPSSRNKTAQVVILFLLGWTYFFNVAIKEQSFAEAFFQLIDTISEDLVMGGGAGIIAACLLGLLLLMGHLIVDFLSSRDFFVRLEHAILGEGSFLEMLTKTHPCTNSEEQAEAYPSTSLGAVMSLVFVYLLGMVSVIVLSQPLLFCEPHTDEQIQGVVLFSLTPMLAFRGVALFGYTHLREQVGFLVFVGSVLILLNIGWLLGFLPEIFSLVPKDIFLQRSYIYSVILFSFIPVLLEGLAWLMVIFSSGDERE
jgi:hypothetical protein